MLLTPMTSLTIAFIYPLLAFVVCYGLLTGLLHRVDRLPLDIPNERSLHSSPVPRIGGVGIVAGVLAAMLLLQPDGVLGGLLLLALGLAAISWLDDVHGLPVKVRLPAHVLVAVVFILSLGEHSVMTWILAVSGMVWMINLFNFMDGADGLAGGMAVVGFGVYALVAWQGGGHEVALVCLCIAASGLAFLRFNFPPASLFLGDSGSIPLGFLAAGLGWLGVREGLWPPLFPLLVFSPFIVDASVTLLTRLLRGERFWRAHRSHYYQRLVRMGLSHRHLAVLAYGLMLSAALSALALVYRSDLQWGLVMVWAVFYLGAMLWVDRRWRRAGHAH